MSDVTSTDLIADQPATMGQRLTAEALGTFILVFLGCGAAVASGDLAAIGLAFGIAIVICAYSFGRISGGHFNPAVSVGASIAGRQSWKDTGLYAIAQTAGALVGGLVLALVALGSDWEFGDPLGNNGYGDDYNAAGINVASALLVEVVLTAIFLFVILALTDARNREVKVFAPLGIGLALAAIHFVGINLTGTSVNPARSIGVAFYSGSDAIQDLWAFIVAPLVGAALAGVVYPLLFGRDATPVPGSGLSLGSGAKATPAYGQPWGGDQGQFGGGMGVQAGQAGQVGQVGGAGQPQGEPIIQNGWQWDPVKQEWFPAPQAGAQAPMDPQAAPQAGQAGQPGATQGEWTPPGDDSTIVRPPQ